MPNCGWSSFNPGRREGTWATPRALSVVEGQGGIAGAECEREGLRRAPFFRQRLEDLEGLLVTIITPSSRRSGRIVDVERDYLVFATGGTSESIPLSQISSVRVCPVVSEEAIPVVVE